MLEITYNTTRLGVVSIRAFQFALQWHRNKRQSRPKSPASRFVQVQIKESIKAPRHWLLWGEFTVDQWIPHTKGQWRGKCFNSMTSSCVYWTSIKMPQSIQSLIHLLAQSDSHSVGHSLTYSVTHPLTCTIFLIESYQPTNKSCLLWVDGRLHVVWYHSSLSSHLLPVSGDANLNDAIPKVFSTKYCLVNAGNSKQINVNKCCIFIYIMTWNEKFMP